MEDRLGHVAGEGQAVVLGRVGKVERVDVVELEALQAVLLHGVADGVAELAVAVGDHRAARGHGPGVPEHRVVQVGLAALGLLQWDRPVDVQVRVREVHEGVRPFCSRLQCALTRYVYAVPSSSAWKLLPTPRGT